MAWIELHQSLPTHRKLGKLKRLLKIKTPQAVGHLAMLWLWCIDNAPDGNLSGIDASDTGGRPSCFPFALAFSTPERTRSRIMDNSSWENTPAICKNASVIGSICPSRQSMVMLPTIINRRCLSRMISMISQSCLVERANLETSNVMIVSPGSAALSISFCCSLEIVSPCSNSNQTLSTPCFFNSRVCRLMSCRSSLVEHLAYPCVTEIPLSFFVTKIA